VPVCSERSSRPALTGAGILELVVVVVNRTPERAAGLIDAMARTGTRDHPYWKTSANGRFELNRQRLFGGQRPAKGLSGRVVVNTDHRGTSTTAKQPSPSPLGEFGRVPETTPLPQTLWYF